ncbi:MAG: hypothetical protein MZU91_00610 [Desulfosudis oleivorans]|nr:hypothetical protein [Desulfosudis oleivorans]
MLPFQQPPLEHPGAFTGSETGAGAAADPPPLPEPGLPPGRRPPHGGNESAGRRPRHPHRGRRRRGRPGTLHRSAPG